MDGDSEDSVGAGVEEENMLTEDEMHGDEPKVGFEWARTNTPIICTSAATFDAALQSYFQDYVLTLRIERAEIAALIEGATFKIAQLDKQIAAASEKAATELDARGRYDRFGRDVKECPICAADRDAAHRAVGPCGHWVCTACWHKLGRCEKDCPTCRAPCDAAARASAFD